MTLTHALDIVVERHGQDTRPEVPDSALSQMPLRARQRQDLTCFERRAWQAAPKPSAGRRCFAQFPT
eukprot:1671040-Prymnesium_polylepis.1